MQQAIHKSAVYEESVPRDWSHSLFSCTDDCGFCLLATCFPACAFCAIQDAHQKVNPRAASVCGMFCLGNPVIQRHVIRKERGIEGDCCTDCLSLAYCGPCAMTQEYLELTQTPAPVPVPQAMPSTSSSAPAYDYNDAPPTKQAYDAPTKQGYDTPPSEATYDAPPKY